ncbi:MAG TPA: 16S rRNA (uracil(1498)-N(3))-methyltransferase [Tenericutes bacterium]|nr:16S rRNA (uracil(1498)-N(3))-methyltransferase [Mycoplasmatota bacterium]
MQRYFSKEKNGDYFILEDGDIHHITNVMRMKNGDNIEVIYNEELYLCEILFTEKQPNIKMIEKQELISNEKTEIILLIPLLKEQKMDLILQKATELGVSKIIPIITERSIIRLDGDKFNKKKERWKKIVKEASEQSKRINIPTIDNLKTLKELLNLEGLKIVCSTIEKDINIKKFLKNNRKYDRIIVAIGPEGGLSLKEEQYLNSIGFTSVSLGSRIMRVETVPLFILSVINYEYME